MLSNLRFNLCVISALQVEVFNILFVTDNKKHLVYCQDCAKKTSINLAGFIVLNQVGIFRSDGIQFTILRAHSRYRPTGSNGLSETCETC